MLRPRNSARYPERQISREERLDSDSTVPERRHFDHTILSCSGESGNKGPEQSTGVRGVESQVDTAICVSIDRSFLSVFAHSMLHRTRTRRVMLLFLCP